MSNAGVESSKIRLSFYYLALNPLCLWKLKSYWWGLKRFFNWIYPDCRICNKQWFIHCPLDLSTLLKDLNCASVTSQLLKCFQILYSASLFCDEEVPGVCGGRNFVLFCWWFFCLVGFCFSFFCFPPLRLWCGHKVTWWPAVKSQHFLTLLCRIHGETSMKESFSSATLLPVIASAVPPLRSHFLLEHKKNKLILLMEVSSELQGCRNRICPCWQFKVKLLYILTGVQLGVEEHMCTPGLVLPQLTSERVFQVCGL